LHCSVYFGEKERTAAPERQKLFRHALCPMPLLESLVIVIEYINLPPTTPTIQDLDISNHFPSLRSMYIDSPVDFPGLLQRLPRTIITLGLTTRRELEFPYDDLEMFLRDAGNTHPLLAHLCLYRRRSPPAAIWELAEALNVTIHLLRARTPLLCYRARFTKTFPMVSRNVFLNSSVLLIWNVSRMIGN
jgi:hypothetical protein